MELQEFIQNFANQFDDTDAELFSPSTLFRDLDEWSSLIGLSIILMVDEEYGITIGADDMKKAQTIEELFNVVKSKANGF
ncbi:MAG: acyl carrier protein [Bacteroidales bacterium]|nr:acyl carrier protein [Bacteroidales bacterium]